MGVPQKFVVAGQTVFACCKGCDDAVRSRPAEILAKVAAYKAGGVPKP